MPSDDPKPTVPPGSRAPEPRRLPAADPRALRRAAQTHLQRLGVSRDAFERRERAQPADSGAAEAFWALAHQALDRFLAARDWDGAGVAYLTLARWTYEYEPAQSHLEFQRRAAEAQVLDFQGRRHHRRVAIVARCCATCDARDGEEYSFARALEQSPLPSSDCELEWCSCTWRGTPVRR